MNAQMQLTSKASPEHSFISVKEEKILRKQSWANEHDEDCPRCQNGLLNLQRSSTNMIEPSSVPQVVHEVLNSPGQPLDVQTRSFMEPRFGHDFSKVRIHTDEKAARSAQMVDALAYNIGNNVIFRTGQYAPQTTEGKILLAHELAHTVQQEKIPVANFTDAGIMAVSSPSDSLEQAADKIALSVVLGQPVVSQWLYPSIHFSPDLMSSQGITPLLQRQTGGLKGTASRNVPQRGANPADCILPQCDQVSKPPLPRNDDELRQKVKTWLNVSLECVRKGASGSNASHSAEIQANNEKELKAAADSFIRDIDSMSPANRNRYRHEAVGWLQKLCRRHYRQAKIEFYYNVVFENVPGGEPWGYSPAEWDDIEGALALLPAEAAWMNSLLLRFRRQDCHPIDVDPNTGQCKGRGTGVVQFVGGETNPTKGQITIFNEGLGQKPYGRSMKLGLSATFQTLRHEVGHVVISQIPQSDKDILFNEIIQWYEYPWDWITKRPAPYPTWQNERNRLRKELQFEESQLDTWLSNLTVDVPVVIGLKTYTKVRTPGGSGFFLTSYGTSKVPEIKELEYARTNNEEYLAELYSLAVSVPEFLYSVLPEDEAAWLKRKIFQIPENLAALARQTALSDPAQTEFVTRGSRLFTWEQLDLLMNELLVKYQQLQGRLA